MSNTIEKFVFDAVLEEAETLGVGSEGLTEFGCGCVNAYNKILVAALRRVRDAEESDKLSTEPVSGAVRLDSSAMEEIVRRIRRIRTS